MGKVIPAIDRFFNKITLDNECWVWDKSGPNGYGEFTEYSDKYRAHIWSYLFFVGPYDRSLDIDHTCHNSDKNCSGGISCHHRRCVNPEHLEPVTRRENAKRGKVGAYLKNKTHCVHGHECTPINTIIRKNGYRGCRVCKNRSETLRTRQRRLLEGKRPRAKRVLYV